MPPETFASTTLDHASLDFTRRAAPHALSEWMDEPCTYAQFRDCLHDLRQVNRVTLAYRPTLRFLNSLHAASSTRPLRIVDVGSGGGDTLRVIERWARRKRLAVTLTGVDLNPYAARAAREFSLGASEIKWVTADAFSFTPANGIDVVISSLFTHHLEEAKIVSFLTWMERTARVGWFVNDLRRSHRSFRLFRALARIARWHAFVQHDGPVSIRRSFRADDWTRMLAKAGMPSAACKIKPRFPGRLCVERSKVAAKDVRT